jgi:hypothetical protein
MDSEEDNGREDFEGALDRSVGETLILANGGEEGNPVSAGGLCGDTWELFGQTGVREDSF